jgi:hypothetical protein
VPTGIITDVTNRDTKSIRFTTTEAMEGQPSGLSTSTPSTIPLILTPVGASSTLVTVTARIFSAVSLPLVAFITTVDVSTPENTDKMITLATNKGGASFTIVDGADDSVFCWELLTYFFPLLDDFIFNFFYYLSKFSKLFPSDQSISIQDCYK